MNQHNSSSQSLNMMGFWSMGIRNLSHSVCSSHLLVLDSCSAISESIGLVQGAMSRNREVGRLGPSGDASQRTSELATRKTDNGPLLTASSVATAVLYCSVLPPVLMLPLLLCIIILRVWSFASLLTCYFSSTFRPLKQLDHHHHHHIVTGLSYLACSRHMAPARSSQLQASSGGTLK
jgi:hypothetical protein